jgi:hypothetical protein
MASITILMSIRILSGWEATEIFEQTSREKRHNRGGIVMINIEMQGEK